MPFEAIDPTVLLLLALLVFFANGVETIIGFGGTVLVIAPAAHVLPLDLLVPVLLPLNLILSMVIVWRHYEGIAARALWRQVFPVTMLGMPLGFAALSTLPLDGLQKGLGALVMIVALLELMRTRRRAAGGPRKPLPGWAAALWLFAGGLAQGAFLSGGPMVVYYANRNLGTKAEFRATLSALWMLLNYVLLMAHVAAGKIHQGTVMISGLLFLPLLAGLWLGERLHPRIDETVFRVVVLLLLLLAGLSILLG